MKEVEGTCHFIRLTLHTDIANFGTDLKVGLGAGTFESSNRYFGNF